jgi:serine/threonine protein kinase
LYTLFKEEKIIHRDLKPQNILINEYGRAFIADIGVAKRFEATYLGKHKAMITSPGGSESWMAPEMLLASLSSTTKIPAYLSKLDVFSLGLITLNAIDRDSFMKYKGKLNTDKRNLEQYLQEVEKKGLINDKEFLSVLRRMLSFDIDSRIPIEKLYHWMVTLFLITILSLFYLIKNSFRFIETAKNLFITSRNN